MRRFNDLLLCDELHAVCCNCRFLNENTAKLQHLLHRRCDAFQNVEFGDMRKNYYQLAIVLLKIF